MVGTRGVLERQAHPRAAIGLRIRREGGGRKALTETDPGLLQALERLVDPDTPGIPNRRCVGPARAPSRWRQNCSGGSSGYRPYRGRVVEGVGL